MRGTPNMTRLVYQDRRQRKGSVKRQEGSRTPEEQEGDINRKFDTHTAVYALYLLGLTMLEK